MLTIIEDTKQKIDKHRRKNKYWQEHGIKVIRCGLPYGDYVKAPTVSVDTKQDIAEIGNNMCGSAKEKHRFAEECKLAKESGCKLIFLIEDARYKDIGDLYGKIIRLHNGMDIPGDQLATAMHTMSGRYGCLFMFCSPKDTAKTVIDLLEAYDGR